MGMMLNPASRRLGRYELISYLGSGGMSDVYVALHTGLHKRVAIKLLRPTLRFDASAVARFLREGQCAARVRHPNVVDVSDVGIENGVPYLVMELLEGETLAHKLAREGALEVEHAVDLLLPILEAVAATHDAGVLHRDIKPANIVLARAPGGSLLPKLVDFGIALMHEDSRRAEAALGPLGTPHYMAPEQARAEPVDDRSDQYSIGSVLFEMLTGREPFGGGSVEAVLAEVARGKFPRLSSARKGAPAELEAVLACATSFKPAQRFDNVSDFADALVPFSSERTRRVYLTREERAGLCNAPLRTSSSRPADAARAEPRREAVSVASSVVVSRSAVGRIKHLSLRALAGTALLGLGLVTGFGFTHGVAEAGAPTGDETSALSDSPSSQAALAAPLSRALRLVPADAVAALDGSDLGKGPVVLPRLDDGMHELRISAPGHVARVVLFRGDLPESTITLERKRR